MTSALSSITLRVPSIRILDTSQIFSQHVLLIVSSITFFMASDSASALRLQAANSSFYSENTEMSPISIRQNSFNLLILMGNHVTTGMQLMSFSLATN